MTLNNHSGFERSREEGLPCVYAVGLAPEGCGTDRRRRLVLAATLSWPPCCKEDQSFGCIGDLFRRTFANLDNDRIRPFCFAFDALLHAIFPPLWCMSNCATRFTPDPDQSSYLKRCSSTGPVGGAS